MRRPNAKLYTYHTAVFVVTSCDFNFPREPRVLSAERKRRGDLSAHALPCGRDNNRTDLSCVNRKRWTYFHQSCCANNCSVLLLQKTAAFQA